MGAGASVPDERLDESAVKEIAGDRFDGELFNSLKGGDDCISREALGMLEAVLTETPSTKRTIIILFG
jgi:hypothetical protein